MDNNSNQTPKKPSREIFRFRGVYTRFYFFLVSSCKISIRESSVTRLRIYNFPLWTEQKKENIESTNSIQIDSFAEEKSHPANCRKITPTPSIQRFSLSLSLSRILSSPLLHPSLLIKCALSTASTSNSSLRRDSLTDTWGGDVHTIHVDIMITLRLRDGH